MPLTTTIGRVELILPPWNTSSLMVLPARDMTSFVKASKTLQRHFECPKISCFEYDAQDVMRAMSDHLDTTWNRPMVTPNITVPTLHGKLLTSSFTIHMAKSRTNSLHSVCNAPTAKQCNPSLTVNEMPFDATHPVHLGILVRQKGKLRSHPVTMSPLMLIGEYARIQPSTSCTLLTLCNSTVLFNITQGSSSPQQVPSVLALLFETSMVLLLLATWGVLKIILDYLSRIVQIPPLLKGSVRIAMRLRKQCAICTRGNGVNKDPNRIRIMRSVSSSHCPQGRVQVQHTGNTCVYMYPVLWDKVPEPRT